MIDYVSDWRARLRSKIYWQFREKPKLLKWIDMIAAQAQDLEDATQALLTIVSIDDSVGAQLDNLGRVLGQPRLTAVDATYRLYLKARILANRSNGTPEDLFRVFRMLFGAGTLYVPGFVKQFAITISTVLTPAQASVGAYFLGLAKEAGARGLFEWQEVSDDLSFCFEDGTGLGFDVGCFAGAAQA